MAYTEEQTSQITSEQAKLSQELRELMLQTVVQGQASDHLGVREHLLHGVARRVSVLGRAIDNIFGDFPLDTNRPLKRKVLADIEINLHAFVINLYGIFDNWAWAFVFRHNLEAYIGGRRGVGLFNRSTTKYLPPPLRDYLSSETITKWREDYLKSFRDALAHRIPLYIPPAEFTPEEGARYNLLENEKMDLIRAKELGRLEVLNREQENIGCPSFTFLHAFEENEQPKRVLFHPQMLCDAATVVEFGNLFLEHWNERV